MLVRKWWHEVIELCVVGCGRVGVVHRDLLSSSGFHFPSESMSGTHVVAGCVNFSLHSFDLVVGKVSQKYQCS